MDIFIKRALEEMGIRWNDVDGLVLKTKKDIDFIIKQRQDLLLQCEIQISDLQECIEQLKDEIQTMQTLKHQTLVEEYKELNKDKDLEIF